MRGEKGPMEAPIFFKPELDADMQEEHTKDSTSSSALKQVSHVRTNFPETWLWSETSTGYDITMSSAKCCLVIGLLSNLVIWLVTETY